MCISMSLGGVLDALHAPGSPMLDFVTLNTAACRLRVSYKLRSAVAILLLRLPAICGGRGVGSTYAAEFSRSTLVAGSVDVMSG